MFHEHAGLPRPCVMPRSSGWVDECYDKIPYFMYIYYYINLQGVRPLPTQQGSSSIVLKGWELSRSGPDVRGVQNGKCRERRAIFVTNPMYA